MGVLIVLAALTLGALTVAFFYYAINTDRNSYSSYIHGAVITAAYITVGILTAFLFWVVVEYATAQSGIALPITLSLLIVATAYGTIQRYKWQESSFIVFLIGTLFFTICALTWEFCLYQTEKFPSEADEVFVTSGKEVTVSTENIYSKFDGKTHVMPISDYTLVIKDEDEGKSGSNDSDATGAIGANGGDTIGTIGEADNNSSADDISSDANASSTNESKSDNAGSTGSSVIVEITEMRYPRYGWGELTFTDKPAKRAEYNVLVLSAEDCKVLGIEPEDLDTLEEAYPEVEHAVVVFGELT